MRILLDTHTLLWALLRPERLAPAHRELLESPEHQIFFSAVNIWEIAIKRALDPTFRTTKATISHFGKRVSSEAGVAAVSNASGRE